MKQLRLKSFSVFVCCITLFAILAFAERQTDSQTISSSGTSTAKIGNTSGSVTASFEEIISGTPATVSIVIKGCKASGTCDTLETNTTTTAAQIRTPTISKVYDYFTITPSWTGGTNVTVQINTTLTTAVNGGGFPGGVDTDIQYNNAGALGGITDGSSVQVLHGGRTFGSVVNGDIGSGAVTDDKASLAVKPAVTVVASSNTALSGTLTIDGVVTADGSLVLATAQSTGSQNGPWVVHSGAWTRPVWYPSGGTTQGIQFSTTFVRLGTAYQGSTWRMTTAAPITIDTTATTWTQTPLVLSATSVLGTLPVANGGTGNATGPAMSVDATQFAGADAAAKVNACVTAAIAAKVTCDARGLTGTQTGSTEFQFGDAAGDPVTILLPSAAVWTTTVNDGTHCGFRHYAGASIIGSPASGVSQGMKFANGPTANPLYLYCTDTTGGNYFYMSGVTIYNQTVATASGIGAAFEGPFFDATSWDSNYVLDGKDTYAAQVHKGCCSASFSRMQFDAEYGGIPLYVLEDDVTGKQEGVNFISDTMVKPGSGKPAVKVSDVSHRMTLNFVGSYTETNTSDTTTALWQISGPKAVNITGLNFHANVASSTATGVTLDNSYNTQLNVTGLTMGAGSGTFTYPGTAIVNSFTANTVSTDANGNLGSYLSTPSTIDGILTLRGASAAQLKMGPLTNLSLFNNLSVTDAGSGGVNINIDPTPSAAAQTSQIRVGRGLNNTGGLEFTLFKGDGSAIKAFDVLNGISNSWGNRVVDPNQFGALANYSVTPCETSSAPTTLATGAAFTDTTANCLTGNSTILFVTARVTTTITGSCTGWSIGDATTTSRFSTNNTTLTAGTSTDAAHIGTYNNTGIASATTGMWQAANAKVRITCAGGNPGAGAIRVEVFAITPTAPTS